VQVPRPKRLAAEEACKSPVAMTLPGHGPTIKRTREAMRREGANWGKKCSEPGLVRPGQSMAAEACAAEPERCLLGWAMGLEAPKRATTTRAELLRTRKAAADNAPKQQRKASKNGPTRSTALCLCAQKLGGGGRWGR